MATKFANNATSRTIVELSPSDTTLTVQPGDGNLFPHLGEDDTFLATLVNALGQHEIVRVTARTGDMMTMERAQEGTMASAFPIASRFELRLTAGAFIEIIDDIRTEAMAAISAVADTIVPIGMIAIMPANFVPPNYVRPNGALLSRASYPRLWAFANNDSQNIVNESAWAANPAAFSRGDGSTNFRIPDVRGEFMRFWDEGRGVDPGRAFASIQGSQNLIHNHSAWDNGHNHGVNDPGHAHGVADPGHSHAYEAPGSGVGIIYQPGGPYNRWGAQGVRTEHVGTGIWIHGAGTGIWLSTSYASIGVGNSGGSEARPRNVAYLPVMRYQ
jgi:microcystin-dependent protein